MQVLQSINISTTKDTDSIWKSSSLDVELVFAMVFFNWYWLLSVLCLGCIVSGPPISLEGYLFFKALEFDKNGP